MRNTLFLFMLFSLTAYGMTRPRTEKKLSPIKCPSQYNVIVEGTKADCYKKGSKIAEPRCKTGKKMGGYSCAKEVSDVKPIECKNGWTPHANAGRDSCQKSNKSPDNPKNCKKDYTYKIDFSGSSDKCVKKSFVPTEYTCDNNYIAKSTLTDPKAGTFYVKCHEPDSYVDPSF